MAIVDIAPWVSKTPTDEKTSFSRTEMDLLIEVFQSGQSSKIDFVRWERTWQSKSMADKEWDDFWGKLGVICPRRSFAPYSPSALTKFHINGMLVPWFDRYISYEELLTFPHVYDGAKRPLTITFKDKAWGERTALPDERIVVSPSLVVNVAFTTRKGEGEEK